MNNISIYKYKLQFLTKNIFLYYNIVTGRFLWIFIPILKYISRGKYEKEIVTDY